jgi:hypothetical protein
MQVLSKIPAQLENPSGFHRRYDIRKLVFNSAHDPNNENEPEYKSVPPDPESEYFVLRLDKNGKDKKHIEACRIAINSYADAIQHHLPRLANELRDRYPVDVIQKDNYEVALNDVFKEVRRAKSIYKEDFHNQHEGYAVILEEIDKLWDEVKKNQRNYDIPAQRKEAIQCAAMCIRFIAELTPIVPIESAPLPIKL